jgi:3-hydroxypropanoate dehydrogenase
MSVAVEERVLDQLFRQARTHNGWLDKPVSEQTLRQLYDLAKMGPTSANCQPMRLVFVKGDEARKQLASCVAPGNLAKVQTAPVTAIVAHDSEFYEQLPRLFPHTDARSWFVGNPELIRTTAFRNGTLQGAYLILAARALGLDCGPMSGFDNAKVDALFFPDGKVQSNFLVSLGYGDVSKLFPRSPRLDFDEACRIA